MKIKWLCFVVCFFVLISACRKDQPIPNDIFLTTQAEVDNFNYTYLPGNLTIRGELIRDLTPLNKLTHVGGSLSLCENYLLSSLVGLENLTQIDSALNIAGNFNLKNLDGLKGLTKVGSGMYIADNRLLVTLNGLSNLADFDGYFVVSRNDNLEKLLELKVPLLDVLSVSFNKKLYDFRGLECIETLNTLMLAENLSLVSFSGLQNIHRVETYLNITGNQKIESCIGLDKLEYAGQVWIGNNEMLKTLDGLNSLKEVRQGLVIGGHSTIAPNTNLTDFCAISNLVLTKNREAVVIVNNGYNPTYDQFAEGKCAQ